MEIPGGNPPPETTTLRKPVEVLQGAALLDNMVLRLLHVDFTPSFVLVARWQSTNQHRELLFRAAQWTVGAQCSRQAGPATHSTKFALTEASMENARWDLQSHSCDVRIRELFELGKSGRRGSRPDDKAVLVDGSLGPRRAGGISWLVRFSLAITQDVVVETIDGTVRLSARLLDQQAEDVGSAALLLVHSASELASSSSVEHQSVPVQVRLRLAQLERRSHSRADSSSGSIVVEVAVTGQTKPHAFRSQPLKLCDGTPFPPVEIPLLEMEDCTTQLIRLTVYRYHPKERSHRIAEGFLVVHLPSNVGDAHTQSAIVTLGVASSSNNQRASCSVLDDADKEKWGELAATMHVQHVVDGMSTPERKSSTILHVDSHYLAKVADSVGALDIVLLDVALVCQRMSNAMRSLKMRFEVLPGKWAKTLVVNEALSSAGGVDLKRESLRAPLQWSTKERSIPALRCRLEMQEVAAESSQLIPSSIVPRVEGSTGMPDKMEGSSYADDVHLTMLLAYPDEWMPVELVFVNKDREGTNSAVATLRLLLRMGSSSSRPVSLTQVRPPACASGHILVSRIRAGGVFMKGHHPNDEYKLQLTSGGVSMSTAPSTSDTAVEIAWSAPLSCPVSSEAIPLLHLSVLRVKTANLDASTTGLTAENAAVASLLVPLPATVMNHNHLVSFSLPLSLPSVSQTRVLKKVGVIRFDLQHLPSQEPTPHVEPSTRLDLHSIRLAHGTDLINGLLDETLNLRCDVSVVMGDSLSDVVWTRSIPKLYHQKVSSTANEISIDCSVDIDDASIRRLQRATAKAAMIIKLLDNNDGRLFGQCVVAVRGMWDASNANFAHALTDKWHKLYAPTRRHNGNPEAIGEIHMSATTKHDEDMSIGEPTETVEGWVLLEVLEAVLTSANERGNDDAHVRLQHERKGKTSKSGKRRGSNGLWRWENDAVFVIPACGMAEKSDSFHYRLVFGACGAQEVPVVTSSEFASLVGRLDIPCSDGQVVEDWLVASMVEPTDLQVHVRLRYIPAVSGVLRVTVEKAASVCNTLAASSLRSIPIDRLCVRCSSVIAPKDGSSSPKPTEVGVEFWQQLHRLSGDELRLEVTTCGPWRGMPTVNIQVIGLSSSLRQEMCFATGSVEVANFISASTSATSGASPQWVNLFSKHDPSVRVGVALVRMQFSGALERTNNTSVVVFPSHDSWTHACSVVLTLWKKLFYMLDSDRGGSIDIDEFSELFTRHTGVFLQTQDGKWLLRVLAVGTSDDTDTATALLSKTENVRRLFTSIDTDGDGVIQWSEFVSFIQTRLLSMEPAREPLKPPSVEARPPKSLARNQSAKNLELRKKRREDSHTNGARCGDATQRMSVRQLRASPRATCFLETSSGSGAADSVREEHAQLTTKLATIQALLGIEQQTSARLMAELRELRASTLHLQLQREREVLERQTKEKMMQEAIREHERMLHEREILRARYSTASIVLQSKVRSRLEQKKFQALKVLRWNSALKLQSAYRSYTARTALALLRQESRIQQKRDLAARRIQRFLRFHVRRNERAMLRHARQLSAVIIQKHARRMLAVTCRKRNVRAALTVQCWQRQRVAKQIATRLHWARRCLSHWMKLWLHRRRWLRIQRAAWQMQRWWRRANDQRWDYLERVEAAMCIQAVWRGAQVRREWTLMHGDERAAGDSNEQMMATSVARALRDEGEEQSGETSSHEAASLCELLKTKVMTASQLNTERHLSELPHDSNELNDRVGASEAADDTRLTERSEAESFKTPEKEAFQARTAEMVECGDESLPPERGQGEVAGGKTVEYDAKSRLSGADAVTDQVRNEALYAQVTFSQPPSTTDVAFLSALNDDRDYETAELREVLGRMVEGVAERGKLVPDIEAQSPGSSLGTDAISTVGNPSLEEAKANGEATSPAIVVTHEATSLTECNDRATHSPSLINESEAGAAANTEGDNGECDEKALTDEAEDRQDRSDAVRTAAGSGEEEARISAQLYKTPEGQLTIRSSIDVVHSAEQPTEARELRVEPSTKAPVGVLEDSTPCSHRKLNSADGHEGYVDDQSVSATGPSSVAPTNRQVDGEDSLDEDDTNDSVVEREDKTSTPISQGEPDGVAFSPIEDGHFHHQVTLESEPTATSPAESINTADFGEHVRTSEGLRRRLPSEGMGLCEDGEPPTFELEESDSGSRDDTMADQNGGVGLRESLDSHHLSLFAANAHPTEAPVVELFVELAADNEEAVS